MKLTLHVNGLPLPDCYCRRHRCSQTFIKYVIVMKLFLITLLFSMNVTASVYSQKVTLSVTNASLQDVMREVRKQTGHYFMYTEAILKDAKRVSVEIRNADLEDALQQIFKDQPYTYSIKDNAILIKRKSKTLSDLMDDVMEAIKRITITGTVINKSGMPLPGVSVAVKGSNTGTVTNALGYYKLEANENDVLRFSFIGYQTSEIVVGKQVKINVVLQELTEQLDQVQIIGYGTTTQRLSTGNVAVIRSNVISSQPVANPLQALTGRVAGLQITQTSGLPGKDITVKVRGRNSITASNNPLYIVDGVPFASESVNRLYSASPINNISPEDIESVSVLKDADATAIYGSRGANGVILITTKKGKPGKTAVSAKISTGWSEVSRTAQVLNTPQYLQLRKDAFTNSNATPTNTNAPDLLLWDQNLDNNWQDWFMGRTASNTDAALSFSGGIAQTTFLLSGTYHSENTVQFSRDYFKRSNAHMSLTHRSLDDRFHLSANAFYTYNNTRLANINGLVIGAVPNFPVYNSDGKYNWTTTNYVAQSNAYISTGVGNLNANVLLDYGLLPGLTLRGSVGYNRLDDDYMAIFPSTSFDPAFQTTGQSSFSNGISQTLLVEPQITYSRKIGSSNLDFLAGATIQSSVKNARNVSAVGYTNDLLLNNPGYGSSVTASGVNSKYRFSSVFSRVTYSMLDRYIINGTFRRDGSSRFGDTDKFGNFGSIGAAWIFSNESFMRPATKLLSFGKLRGSYGSTGSDGIGDYQYLSTYAASTPYGAGLTIIPNKIANQNYGWEVNRKLEAAIDLGFLENRILFSTAWYRNRSSSQLVSYGLPSMTGFGGYTANLPAEVENTGWEFDLNIKVADRGNFIWDSSFNITIPKNKLRSFPHLLQSSYANSFVIGESLDIVQLYHYTGVDQQTGFATVLDKNGDGVFTPSSSCNNQGGDYIIAGNTAPKWFGGFNNSISFKGIQLDVFFQYTRQDGYNLFSYVTATSRRSLGTNAWTDILGYWRKPGDATDIPKPVSASDPSIANYRSSDVMFADASFLRLKNVMLSYKIPKRLSTKLKLNDLKIYAQGQNLWTATDYKGYDPELADRFNNIVTVPTLRNFSIGLQASF